MTRLPRVLGRPLAAAVLGAALLLVAATIIGLALGPMGAAFVTWYLALRDGDPRRIGALAYLTPLLSTLLLVWLNGEALTPRHLLAGGLIMGGALLGLLVKSPSQRELAQPLS